MKGKFLKGMVVALAITLIGGAFAGCGNNNAANNAANNTTKQEATQKEDEITGSITAVGSSAMQPLVLAAAQQFMSENPKATINVQGGGSGTGISSVAEGAVEIGNSDVYAEEKLKGEKAELAKELVDHKVCAIGFSVVVNSGVTVDSLTKAQIQDIFQGKITNWSEVGGQDLKIEVVNRGKSSGTRATFNKTVMDGKDENDSIGTVQDSSGAVQKTIQATEGSISYLALSYFVNEDAKKGMNLIKIDGVEATTEKIGSGDYPFWAWEHMYTKGEATGLTKIFIDYMFSDDVKPLIESKGYIPASLISVE